MELLFSVAILLVLAVLALRYGYDSREGIQSKEAELARIGMAWPEGLPWPLIRPVRPVGRRRRLRRAMARALFALADWLSPGLPAARTS